ncbi:MAG: 4Fe-4S binding protein [bacterium]|jgi:NAD-dependent dihydropyrimidine dehydrogenase PreA subunit
MSEAAYEHLARALDALPGGFPRTPSGIELRLLEKILSPEEARLASHLTVRREPVDAIAKRAGLPPREAGRDLVALARRGIVWSGETDGGAGFRLAPFIVGIYEAQLTTMDEEFARLYEQYMEQGGAAGIMRPLPSLHRVLPGHGAIEPGRVLPYDDVRAIIEKGKTFRIRGCICRVQQDLIGDRKCDFPLENCITIYQTERPPSPDDISMERAIEILDETEKMGLVHTTANVVNDITYICNCCGCCCGILRGFNEWGIDEAIARANYLAIVDAEACSGCEICVERCQVGAMSMNDGAAHVDAARCIGCGLCVTGCPGDAVRLKRKPDAEIVEPPVDYATWERERLRNRGLDAADFA